MASEMKRDGGPAFPVKGGMIFYAPEDLKGEVDKVAAEIGAKYAGMSLRDWFAGQTDIRAYDVVDTLTLKLGTRPTVAQLAAYIAEIRFIEADAMLAARSKESQ